MSQPALPRLWTHTTSPRTHGLFIAALAALLIAPETARAQTATPTATPAVTATPTTTPVPTFNPEVCYAVPDSTDQLIALDPVSGAETVIGPTGAGSTLRGLAIPPVGNTLYGATATTLGTVNTATGAFTAIGSFGTALNGDLGPLELDNLVAMTFSSGNGVLYGVQRTSLDPDECFSVEATGDTLVTIDRIAGTDAAVGATTNGVQAAALVGSTLYAAIGDQLGIIDRASGTFTARSASFGQGDPGAVDFDDVRGLAYDHDNFVMYASNREPGADDVLFIAGLVTGAHVPLQFNGATDDYVTISGGSCASPIDIEALAILPSGAVLYASDGDELVTIDTLTGTCNVVGAFGGFGPAITITGMGFDDNGDLYGTDTSQFYSIDIGTGAAAAVGGPLAVGSDYRALACPLVVPDALFRIDPASGSYVPLEFAFETADYALIEGGGCGTEVEALAYDQFNDVLFGIDGTNDRLMDIDLEDGFCSNAVPNPLGTSDIVSMTYAEATNEVYAAGTSDLYTIDRTGGAATVSSGLTAGTNYEALECPTTGCRLVVRKRHIGVPFAGQDITYRLFWLNPCQGVTFTNVVLTDELPTGLDLVSAASTSATVQSSGDTVTLTDAFVAKGPAEFGTLRANITAGVGSRVTNTITLRDNFGREFSSSDTIRVREPRTRASLSLHAQGKSAPGKTVTYTMRYKDIAATNELTATLPDDVDIVTIFPDPTSLVGNVLTWSNLPTPSGGARVRTRVSDDVTTSTVLTATATMTDSAGADLTSARDTVVTIVASKTEIETPPASISLAAAPRVPAGLVTTISLKYANVQGTGSVNLVLPEEMTPTQTIPQAQVAGNVVSWSDIDEGTGALRAKVLLSSSATPGAVLTVTANLTDSVSGTSSDSVQITVRD